MKTINKVIIVIDDSPYIWRKGDPVEELKASINWLADLLNEPLAIALDLNQPLDQEIPKSE